MPSSTSRLHRSELAVHGSNLRMLEKAPRLGADVVMLDLEDAVARADKERAHEQITAAQREDDWSGWSVSLRINGLDTHWCYRGIVDVVEQAGGSVDTVLIPCTGDVPGSRWSAPQDDTVDPAILTRSRRSRPVPRQ